MSKSKKLNGAAADAALNAKQDTCKGCSKTKVPPVSPKIVIADPKTVLVKKPYQKKGHRLAVRLGTDKKFTGTGTLTCTPAGDITVFDSKGKPQALPLTIAGARLSSGLTLYVEGARPSTDINQTKLSFSLAGGDKPIINSPAADALTCVEVHLDLCRYKAAPGGADPPPVADKISTGRNLHLQTSNTYAGRALLIVHKARPHSFKGQVVLTSVTSGRGKVRTFAYSLEAPAPAQPVESDPLSIANGAILHPGGLKLWVEGAHASSKVLDTGFILGIADVPKKEGDRANITVVKATLDVYTPGPKPSRIAEGSKMNPGRSTHVQDAGNQHKRAKVLVRRVEPANFSGNLELAVWDKTASSAANPRLKLFAAKTPGGAAHTNPHTISHSSAYPAAGKEVWAEGAVLSGALRDTELRLRVSDAEGGADRAAFTVHRFFVSELRFKGTKEIYYARVPDSGSYILPAPADAAPPHKHFSPVELRPAAGAPYWKKKPAMDPDPEFSWPAVYVRRGAAGAPAPEVEASLELHPLAPGTVTAKIKAQSAAGVKTVEKSVTFTDGKAAAVTFPLKGLPTTVKRLDNIELKWLFDAPAHVTKHTLFIVDAPARAANNGLLGLGSADDKYLWEIFEWSCRWANGVAGRKKVLKAIWGRFKPVKAAHATKLVYWKNHGIGIGPAQDLVTAIQSQDDPNPLQQNAASCIVFDRVLMNCLAAHGIASAEIKLHPPAGTFTRGGVSYGCVGWKATSTNGQGNTAAPPGWESHWIADVKAPAWRLYDPSYGAGPVNSNAPSAAGATVDIKKYEPLAVASLDCQKIVGGVAVAAVTLSRSPNPGVPPHLVGTILWTNK
ncbi:MAG: hypothetical protein AAB225_25230 [Acidobacteriota bacterium]